MRIVIVDDHALSRVGIRQVLLGAPGHEVVGETSTAREAFRIIDALAPDVVLMDIAMPGMDGVIATREVARRAPGTRVLIVSADDGESDVLDAFEAGAAGYALKGDAPEELIAAIRTVNRGERYLSASLAARLPAFDGQPRRANDGLAVLSVREREVFRLASDCLRAGEIARELCIARKTVDTHLNRINRKLGLRNMADLVRLAASAGMIHTLRAPQPESGPDA